MTKIDYYISLVCSTVLLSLKTLGVPFIIAAMCFFIFDFKSFPLWIWFLSYGILENWKSCRSALNLMLIGMTRMSDKDEE